MTKLLFLLPACICISLTIHAQTNPQNPVLKYFSAPKFYDSTLFRPYKKQMNIDSLRNTWQPKIPPYDNMPVAGSMPKKFLYSGNNKKGFDIYQTLQDNMYILKPDSSFSCNMPVVGFNTGNNISGK